MPIEIRNSAQYGLFMGQASKKAMKFCLDKCYDDLKKCIAKDLYAAYSPTYYQRTEMIYDAWNIIAGITEGEIDFVAPPEIPSIGAHTSPYGDGSLGEALLDVLEAGYIAYNTHSVTGKHIPPRPFFTKWMKRMEKFAPKWYAQGLRQQGFKVI